MNNLKKYREERFLSQGQLSKITGLSQSMIAKLEIVEGVGPTLKSARVIAHHLNLLSRGRRITVDDIFPDEEDYEVKS